MQNGRGKSKYSSWSPDDLVQFRTEAGISRRDMADKLGVSYRMYCYYESGHTKIDLPLEYAVRWLSVDPMVRENGTGALTDFQKQRIDRLMNAIHKYPASNLDELGQKILSQCVDEISMLSDQARSS
tara:strand:- start:204 stop:584 length:381 start_codon:yes stop_codon:yes gene_type:complete